jgi:hypothetical protein
LVSDRTVLAAALGAALAVGGWRAVQLASADALARTAREVGRVGRLVLVADALGRLPDPRLALAGRSRPMVVAVGTRRAFGMLADIVDRQVATAVLDADQPFADLIATLDTLLRRTPGPTDAVRLAAALRSREDEALRFAGLTRREQEVLAALIAGRSGAEIATAEQASMATVRSHIRAVLKRGSDESPAAQVTSDRNVITGCCTD